MEVERKYEFCIWCVISPNPSNEEVQSSRVCVHERKPTGCLVAFGPVEDDSCYPEGIDESFLRFSGRTGANCLDFGSAFQFVSFGTPFWPGTRALIASICSSVKWMSLHQPAKVPLTTGKTAMISP